MIDSAPDGWPWALVIYDEVWADAMGGRWYTLVDRYGRPISDACVEGSPEEWREIADALRAGSDIGFRRCAVDRRDDGVTLQLYSPRNTEGQPAILPIAYASVLADVIDRTVRS